MSIVAVIVTYNRKALLLECLDAVLGQTADCDVLVIDNHSTDGTRELVQGYVNSSTEGKIIYRDTGSNLGGAGGFSYGIREAVELGYEYLWIMDDDSIPEKDCLEKLLNAAARLSGTSVDPGDAGDLNAGYHNENPAKGSNSFGFLASKVLWTDGSLCAMNIPRDTLNHKLTEFGKEPVPIVIASFVSMLIPAECVKELGLPIKEFFIWVDDWEYARRISSHYPSYLVPDSLVLHKTKSNIGADIIREDGDISRYRYMYRNSVYFYRQEGIKGWIYLVGRTMLHILKVLFCSRTNRLKKIKLIIGATAEGIGFKPEIEKV